MNSLPDGSWSDDPRAPLTTANVEPPDLSRGFRSTPSWSTPMPLTFPAHQVAVLPLKLWKPRWFDGTALVVGAGSPDLFNAFAPIDTFDSHHVDGVLLAIPFTVLYSFILRRFAADGLFGSLPDLRPLRLRHYRVLKLGRPRLLVTSLSALMGVLSHILVDSFTHTNRWGSNLFGLNDAMFGAVSQARLLQYLGHTIGSTVGVLLFVVAVSKRHLGDWYGIDAIVSARSAPLRDGAAQRTFNIVCASVFFGAVWGLAQGNALIFTIGFCFVMGLLAAGIANRPQAIQASPSWSEMAPARPTGR